jgi:hypothetical protein
MGGRLGILAQSKIHSHEMLKIEVSGLLFAGGLVADVVTSTVLQRAVNCVQSVCVC